MGFRAPNTSPTQRFCAFKGQEPTTLRGANDSDMDHEAVVDARSRELTAAAEDDVSFVCSSALTMPSNLGSSSVPTRCWRVAAARSAGGPRDLCCGAGGDRMRNTMRRTIAAEEVRSRSLTYSYLFIRVLR